MLRILISFLFLFIGGALLSQISVSSGQTAQQLAEFLAGPNITVTNAQLSGGSSASGIFSGTNSDIGFDNGVILSTGDATASAGPNNITDSGQDLNEPGTAQMTTLIGSQSFDAIILEFDFEIQSTSIQFDYVFASEEYPEYAPPFSSGYNDAFAFYISGAGIVGEENLALVPNTTDIVSATTINMQNNSQYYVSNPGGQDVEFDGFTTVLTAQRDSLTACQTYHLKLVIADGTDADYNSAVFLKENSLVQDLLNVQTQTVNSNDIALEGCIKASFSFSFNDTSNVDRVITYQIGGTAVNGVDYAYIDTFMVVPAGDTSATVFIDAFSDGITEGQESLYIIYQPDVCSPNDTAFLYIDDSQPIDYSLIGTDLSCFNDSTGQIDISASGGFPPYTYHLTYPNSVEIQTQSNPITGLSAGTYTVLVEDSYGCFAEALVVGGLFDADTTFLPDGSGVSYDAPLDISGFNPGQTITNINQIQQICVNMEHSFLGDLQIEIESPSGQTVVLKQQNGGGSTNLGIPFASDAIDGQNSNLTDPGEGYEYCFNATPNFGTMVGEANNYSGTFPSSTGGTYTDNYLPAGVYIPFENLSGLVGSTMNGTWIIRVTDQFSLDNGYIFNWTISLIGDEPDTTVTLNQPNEIDLSAFVQGTSCGTSNGSINLTVQEGQSPYTYLWSNGATTKDISGLAAGTYTVTVTDFNGCEQDETFAVNNSGSMSLTYSTTPTSCFNGNDGAIDISPSGGTSPYTYSWDNGATSEDLSGVAAGTYTVTVTDQQGCSFSEVIDVSDATEVTVLIASFANEVCSSDNGAINISVTGGTGSYNYLWSNGATTQNISGLSGGVYSVTVTDANGCVANQSQTLINDASNCGAFCELEISNNTIVVDELCGDGNGSIDLITLNGVAPLTYVWSNGATTEDLTGLSIGNYSVTVTDGNNCEETMSFVVDNNTGSLQISSFSISDENCGNNDGAIDLVVAGGSSPYSYVWSSGQTLATISGLTAGSYDLTVTDANGCELTETFVVGNNSGSLSITSAIDNETCTTGNGAIDITSTGGNGILSYSWSNGATSEDISNLSSGQYTITVTDAVGCYVQESYDVLSTAGGISLAGSIIVNEQCGNGQGSINITVTGQNLTYVWSNGATTEDISGLSAGNYSCTITDDVGCTFNTNSFSVLDASGALSISATSITDESCSNGQGAIDVLVSNGAAPYTFTWSNGASTEDITGLSQGVYTVTVTDNNGCTESQSFTVQNAAGTLAASAVVTDENCGDNSGAIDLTVSGGTSPYSFQWSSGATTEDLSGLSAGTYNVTVTDVNGCVISESFTLNNGIQSLAFNGASISHELCSDASGAVSISFNGGLAPYSFLWSNGATTQNIDNLSAGVYSIDITDANGCVVSDSFEVENDPGALAISGISIDEMCGDGTGEIDVTVTNANFPINLSWSSGQTTPDISNLSAGAYTLTIVDNFGCQVAYTDTVENITNNLTVDIASATDENCGQADGSIDANVSGQGPLTYSWNTGQSTEDLSSLSAGNYVLTVTDTAGCSASDSVLILNQTGNLTITFENIGNETCGNGLGFVDIEVSGAGPFTYAWDNGATAQDIIDLSAGTYSVVITDANGCQLSASFLVVNDNTTNLAVTAVITGESCGVSNGQIDITVTGGVNPYTYAWDSGQTTEDLAGITQGSYSVTVSDNVSCSVTETFSVQAIPSDLEITSVDVSDEFCGQADGSIDIDVSGTNSPYTFAWDNGEVTEDISNLASGNYNVTITDNLGCQIDSTINVGSGGVFTVTHTQVDDSCNQNLGSIDLTIQGGPGSYTFDWDNGSTTEDISGLSAGVYNVTVTSDFFFCEVDYSVTIENNSGYEIQAVVTDENCGNGQGSIDQILVSGTNVSYEWSTGDLTEDLSGLSEGSYYCVVTPSGWCSDTLYYTVNNVAGTMQTNAVVVQDSCGSGIGAIDITMSGGSGNYDYSWDNGAITEDLSGLSPAQYVISVTDQLNNCTLTETFTISQINTLFNGSGVVTGTTGQTNADGAIDVTLNLANSYTFSWSNNETTEDIANLLPGTYTLTVTSNHGCDTTMTFDVNNVANIDENQLELIGMEVYPNPASVEFSIDYLLPMDQQGTIEIVDAVGRSIKTEYIYGTNKLLVNAQGMKPGVYFIVLDTESTRLTKRLVIANDGID